MFKGTALSLVEHGVNENEHFNSSKKKTLQPFFFFLKLQTIMNKNN